MTKKLDDFCSGVIAEIGINHCGDIDRAIEMIREAKRAAAAHVKFQKRDVDSCYTFKELCSPCESPWGDTLEDKVKGRELEWSDFDRINSECKKLDIGWSVSAFDLKSLAAIEKKFGDDIVFHKVPSAMSKHEAFLEQVASYGRLTIISVGLAEDLSEVGAVALLFEQRNCNYILNVTTSCYPTPTDRCNVSRIHTLKSLAGELGRCLGIGYSGHEVGLLPSVLAAANGACYIERHFTLDRSWYGADQAASLEPEGLRRLCRDVKDIKSILGNSTIKLYGDEKNPVPNLMTSLLEEP